MRPSFSLLTLLSTLLFFPLAGMAQTAAPPLPTNFDSGALTPKNLPDKLNVPPNMHIAVTAWVKGAAPRNPSLPPDKNNMSLLWDPHLESAVIDSNDKDAHVGFQWEGGRSSEAFLIQGACFRLTCLAYPQVVAMTGKALDFWVSRQSSDNGASGTFPGVSWFSASTFVGKASLNGVDVFVLAPGGKGPGMDTFPAGESLCLDTKTLLPLRVDDGKSIYSFSYTPDHNVQIDPQGFYLKAIKNQFGHYP
jgi:hypothetical protein